MKKLRNSQKWHEVKKDGKTYYYPEGEYATDIDKSSPDIADAPGCTYGITAFVIIVIIMIFLGLRCFAQPQIWLGSSRSAISKEMKSQNKWTLSASTSDVLIYKNSEGTILQYNFVKNGVGWFCTSCVLVFNSRENADKFINDRIINYRFRPSGDGWQLVTDLSDFRINVIRMGNSLIYSF